MQRISLTSLSQYRRGSGLPQRNLGSLYWQLEDIWQGPTWAGIEYSGRWKVLHYTAKDIYSNIIVTPFYNYTTDQLLVYVVSDLWSPASGTATAQWLDWSGNVLSDIPSIFPNTTSATSNGTSTRSVTVGALNATQISTSETLTSLLSSSSHNTSSILLRLTVNMTSTSPNNSTNTTFTHEAFFHPISLAQSPLVNPGLTLSHDNSTQTFTIEATTGVSAWTWLDYPQGVTVTFDTNGFWLAKGETKVVGYEVRDDTTAGQWTEEVTVGSLWNNTQV